MHPSDAGSGQTVFLIVFFRFILRSSLCSMLKVPREHNNVQFKFQFQLSSAWTRFYFEELLLLPGFVSDMVFSEDVPQYRTHMNYNYKCSISNHAPFLMTASTPSNKSIIPTASSGAITVVVVIEADCSSEYTYWATAASYLGFEVEVKGGLLARGVSVYHR